MGHLPSSDPNLRLLLEQVPAILWTTDRDQRVTSIAGSGLTPLGDLSTFVGRPFADLVAAGDASPAKLAAVERALAGESVSLDVDFHGRAYSCRIEPTRDAQGAIVGCVGIALDETERRVAETSCVHALSLLDSTFEATADGLLVVDLEGRIRRWNEKFRTIWRIPPEVLATGRDEDALARAIHLLIDPGPFLAGVHAIYAAPESETFDTIELRDGRVLERFSQPQRIAGRPVGRVWSFRDVTGRVRAERESERLLAAERRARAEADLARDRSEALARASRVLAGSLDDLTTLRAVARAALADRADYVLVDLVGRDGELRRVAAEHRDPARADSLRELLRFVPDRDAPLGIARAIATREPEVDLDIDSGKLWPGTGWSVSGSRDPEHAAALDRAGLRARLVVPIVARGIALGALSLCSSSDPRAFGPEELGFARDLADRAALALDHARLYREARAAEAAAREAVRSREEFIAIASHELRTPLTALTLAVQTLERAARQGTTGSAAGAFARSVSVALRETRRFGRLVHELLDVSRLASGAFSVEPEDLDLAVLACEAAAALEPDALRAGSTLRVDAPAPVRGRWDRTGVERILANLVANALEHGAGAPVDLRVSGADGLAVLEVRDHGPGIPPETQARLFSRPLGPGRGGRGMGLGLALVRGLVEAHGGTIAVESEPGTGASIRVSLPFVTRRGERRAA